MARLIGTLQISGVVNPGKVLTLGSSLRMLAGGLLRIVTLLWAGVYDTLYAMVDRDDDLKLGVHTSGLHWHFYASLLFGAGLFAWQQWLIRDQLRISDSMGDTSPVSGCVNQVWFLQRTGREIPRGQVMMTLHPLCRPLREKDL